MLSVNGKIKDLPVKILTGDLTTSPATAAKGNGTISFWDTDVDVKFVVDGGTSTQPSPATIGRLRTGRHSLRPSAILNPTTAWPTC